VPARVLSAFRAHARPSLRPPDASLTPRELEVLRLVGLGSQQRRDRGRAADLHPHRERGAANYIWQLFDRLEDLRSVLKEPGST
jgi:hypothetical protein